MFVGTFRLRYHLEGIQSLKEKRSILRKVIERTKANFNVSIAEVGGNDDKRLLDIGGAIVGNEKVFIDSKITTLINFIEGMSPGYLINRTSRILNLKD